MVFVYEQSIIIYDKRDLPILRTPKIRAGIAFLKDLSPTQ